ncbi:MAG: HupF/HypC family [Anaerocolumna sp.]|jgi:hydrogenase expression/formation protein HypC|nr:HupF/HypC family [Anaerocolumna sp.]
MISIIPAKITKVNYIEDLHISAIKRKDKEDIHQLALTAQVEILGGNSEINIVMLKDPKPGDYVIIHEGYALKIIDKEYFNYLEMVHKALWEAE